MLQYLKALVTDCKL